MLVRPARRLVSTTQIRDKSFAVLTDKDVSVFESILGAQSVVTETDELVALNTDWTQRWRGNSTLALFPRSVDEVAAALRYCNERRLAVVPQAGRTGLIGGSVPIFDEVILSVTRMNNILAFDDVNGILSAEAGTVMEDMATHISTLGYDLPYNLGSRGSCCLGGNIATNAGGSK